MSARHKLKPRCPGCGLRPELCACDRIPTIEVATRFAIVQHVDELHKPTNTGRLFARMVAGTSIVPYGMREPPFEPGPLVDDDTEWVLLFPRAGAPELDPTVPPAPGRRRGFVILDGTWHQCSRMAKRVPVVRELTAVALPPTSPSFWTVRTQHDPRGMSTFDAAIRVLRFCEGDAVARPLLAAFAAVTARTLFMRGQLPTPEVPPEWLA